MITSSFFRVYRRVLSPDTGVLSFWFPYGCCRFYPSCSRYAEASIQSHGIVMATPRILWRLLRCNPWNAGGYDPEDQ